jgi:hypothetical protein
MERNMKIMIIGLLALSFSMSVFASELYKCEFFRVNDQGVDRLNVKTGWLVADKNLNMLNLQGIDGVIANAMTVKTYKGSMGLRTAICYDELCQFSSLTNVGGSAGMSMVKTINGFRYNILCNLY